MNVLIIKCFVIYILISIILINTECENDSLEEKCEKEASWGLWRCPGEERKCTSLNATRYKCIGGNCTIDSPCVSLPNFTQVDSCEKVLRDGECEPWWATWSPWSQCTATCGLTERTRFRPCIGAWSITSEREEVIESLKRSCASVLRASEGVETADCPVRRFCPVVMGGWGEWGDFSPCSVTCGIGSRSRVRKCDRPKPKGGGLYCQGIDSQQIPCEGSIPCPIRGHWCAWSSTIQKCSQPCGSNGMGLRTRKCACPAPSYGGDDCEIPPEAILAEKRLKSAMEKSLTEITGSEVAAIGKGMGRWDPCNRHLCLYSTILESSEQDKIVNDLNSQKPKDTWLLSDGSPAEFGDSVQLVCPKSKQSRVEIFEKSGRFPKATSYWTRSILPSMSSPRDLPGRPLESSKLLLVEDDQLTIRMLIEPTVGIYRFGFEYEPGYFETVCFFSVYIKNYKWVIQHGSTFDLKCGARGLWPIVQTPNTGRWYVYWDVKLDKQPKDIKQNERWWYTELMKFSKDVDSAKDGASSEVNSKKHNESLITDSSNEVVKDDGTGLTLWDTEYRRVYQAVETMSGYYNCVVLNKINDTFERQFITRSLYIKIEPPPTLWRLVLEWCQQNMKNLTILVIVGILTGLLYALYLWVRAKRIARLEIQAKEAKKAKLAINLSEIDAPIN